MRFSICGPVLIAHDRASSLFDSMIKLLSPSFDSSKKKFDKNMVLWESLWWDGSVGVFCGLRPRNDSFP
jgi:hypothetical protein